MIDKKGGIYMYPIDYLLKVCTAIEVLMKTTVFEFSPFIIVTLEDIFLGTGALGMVYDALARIYE